MTYQATSETNSLQACGSLFCMEENTVAVIIPNISDPRISFWSRVRFLERLSYVGSEQIEAASFFRRDAYKKAGGHDEAMIANEEHDLHNRISRYGKIARICSIEWHIGEPRTLADIAVKYWYYGKSVARYVSRNSRYASVQILPVRHAFVKKRNLLLRDPLIFAGFVIYQSVRYMSAICGFLTTVK